MTKRMDVHSIRARNVRAHLRQSLSQLREHGETSIGTMRRFLQPEQYAEWIDSAKRFEIVRRQQRDSRFLAVEAGYTDLAALVEEGRLLLRRIKQLDADTAKLDTFKSTNASRLRVFRNKAKLLRGRIDQEAAILRAGVEALTEDHWSYVERDENLDWLITFKSEEEFNPWPLEISHAEYIQLLERWITEWDEKIETYESLENSSIK